MSTVALINNFVGNLQAALKKQGMSQAALAREAGVHYVTVNRILKYRLTPTIDVCERLAIAAKMQPEKIFRKPA